jgi:hypothetical protein
MLNLFKNIYRFKIIILLKFKVNMRIISVIFYGLASIVVLTSGSAILIDGEPTLTLFDKECSISVSHVNFLTNSEVIKESLGDFYKFATCLTSYTGDKYEYMIGKTRVTRDSASKNLTLKCMDKENHEIGKYTFPEGEGRYSKISWRKTANFFGANTLLSTKEQIGLCSAIVELRNGILEKVSELTQPKQAVNSNCEIQLYKEDQVIKVEECLDTQVTGGSETYSSTDGRNYRSNQLRMQDSQLRRNFPDVADQFEVPKSKYGFQVTTDLKTEAKTFFCQYANMPTGQWFGSYTTTLVKQQRTSMEMNTKICDQLELKWKSPVIPIDH